MGRANAAMRREDSTPIGSLLRREPPTRPADNPAHIGAGHILLFGIAVFLHLQPLYTEVDDTETGMTRSFALLMACFAMSAPAANANEFELSFYTGFQTAPHANVTGNDPGNGVDEDVDFTPAWEGRPFDMPPYYGIRGTWWRNSTFGVGLEFNHAKVYADEDDAADNGFSRLEFTDGLNIVTVNAFRRWPEQFGDWTPYVGGGVGLAIPHVDVESDGGKTFEYQLTGAAVMWAAGASYPLSEKWDGFVEYKGTYSQNTAELDNGGELEVDFVTNAINLGLTFNF